MASGDLPQRTPRWRRPLCRDEGERARKAFDRDYSRPHRTAQFARVLQSLR